MIIEDETLVGSKGEILPKKDLREKAGIFPGDKIIIQAMKNQFFIKKILSVDEAFNLPVIDSDTPENLRKQIKEEINGVEIGKG